VVLDAAYLRRVERDAAHALARDLRVPFTIIDCDAPVGVLRARLRERRGDASEADEAVLEKLRATAEPLAPSERRHVLRP
jgi:predicted kinase